MKKIFTLAFAVLFGLSTMAQQKSNVVIFSEDGETFFAFLNGIKQNATAQSNVKITDIPGEGASLRLVFANSSDQPLKQDLYFMEPNQEHTIKVKRDKKGVLKMRYFGASPIAQSTSSAPVVVYTTTEAPVSNGSAGSVSTNTTPVNNTVTNTVTTTSTDPYGNGNVNMNVQVSDPNATGGNVSMNTQVSDPYAGSTSQTVTTTTTTNGTGGNTANGSINMSVGVGNNGFNMNVNVSGTGDPGLNSSSTTTTTSTTTTSTSGTTYSSSTGNTGNSSYTTTTTTAVPAGNGCAYAADDASFDKMKKAVEGATFSETKMSTAKTATRNNCLSAEQVKQIMALFNMDEDKLAYAKYAYDYTVDKNNFYQVADVFTFDMSKEELNQFLETK